MMLQLMQNPGGCGDVTTGEPQVGDRCYILFQNSVEFANGVRATARRMRIVWSLISCCLPYVIQLISMIKAAKHLKTDNFN